MKLKKLLLAFIAIAGITLTSCKKDSSSSSVTASNSWKVGSATYTGVISMGVTQSGAWFLGSYTQIPSGATFGSRMMAVFKTKPTTSGTYKIVFNAVASALAADEVMIDCVEETGNMNAIAKTESKTATVTVDANGKVSVTVPSLSAYYGVMNGSLNQTTTIEGNVTEM